MIYIAADRPPKYSNIILIVKLNAQAVIPAGITIKDGEAVIPEHFLECH